MVTRESVDRRDFVRMKLPYGTDDPGVCQAFIHLGGESETIYDSDASEAAPDQDMIGKILNELADHEALILLGDDDQGEYGLRAFVVQTAEGWHYLLNEARVTPSVLKRVHWRVIARLLTP
jgi:hypothetical protein